MTRIAQDTTLTEVERIVGSGTGVLDFEIAGGDVYTWDGIEDADWTVENVEYVENDSEDRFVLYPERDYFTCEITADGEEHNMGPVRCWCESMS